MKIYIYNIIIILFIIISCIETSIENFKFDYPCINDVKNTNHLNEIQHSSSLYIEDFEENTDKCNFDQLFNDNISENYKMSLLQDCKRPSGSEEVYSLLKYLSNLEFDKSHIFNDKILQIFSSVNDNDSIEFLIKVINNEIAGLLFDDFNPTLKFEIYKLIQDYENSEIIGKSLADKIDSSNIIDYSSNLFNTYNPWMIFYLSRYANMHGDAEAAYNLIKLITNISSNSSLNIILKSAEEEIISVESASEIAFDWADLNNEVFDEKFCINIINSKNFSYKQKIITVSALATSKNPDAMINFLSNSDELKSHEYGDIYNNVLEYLNDTLITSQAK